MEVERIQALQSEIDGINESHPYALFRLEQAKTKLLVELIDAVDELTNALEAKS